MNKKVLISGMAGFVGFHLAKHLHSRGDYVVGIDNFNNYYSPQLKRDRAAELKQLGMDVRELDVCDQAAVQKLVDEEGITHFVHLAAQAGVRYSLENPQAYIKANIDGFLSILEVCRNSPGLKLTYASSSSVYGLNEKVPFSTDDRTDHQASLYGATKKSNELMAHSYHHLFGIPVTGLRFFTVYGPWGRPDMAYFSFTQAISEGRSIPVFNHGQMERDFTYIDDIVEGTTAAIDLEAACEVFNLGNHKPEPLMALIETIEEALGKKAQLVMKPMQKGDVLRTYADVEKSQQLLGFQPKTALSEGIPRFVEWYLKYYQGAPT